MPMMNGGEVEGIWREVEMWGWVQKEGGGRWPEREVEDVEWGRMVGE